MMATAAGMNLQSRVTDLYGVGPERAAQLARLKILTIGDLLLHRPLRYEDRRHALNIRDLALKQPALVRGKVVALGIKRYRKGTRSVFELILDDGTARLHCQWWNLPFMESYFGQGDEVVAYGKPKSLKPRTMDHPETEVIEAGEELSIHMNRIVPIYPRCRGLFVNWERMASTNPCRGCPDAMRRFKQFIFPTSWPKPRQLANGWRWMNFWPCSSKFRDAAVISNKRPRPCRAAGIMH